MSFSDRSRYNEYQRCPRARYLGYEVMGTGVRRNRSSIPLTTGISVHVGRANMLSQVLKVGNDAVRADLRVNVGEAVQSALGAYDDELRDRGLDVELGEDAQLVVDEQKALIEGLLRAYAKSGLVDLVERYRVLEVEREDLWERFTLRAGDTEVEPVDFQSRADALLQERSSGDLYIDSLKTAAQFDYRKDSENRHDVQGLSEAATVERRLRVSDPSARIMGIQMTFLVKGMRRQDYEGGPYRTASPLLRGYYREGVTEREYAWKAETPCPGPGHVLKQGKKGPIVCEGKKFHKLGQEWTPFQTYKSSGDIVDGELVSTMEMSEWIDLLASGTVQPEAGDPFAAIVQTPMPYFRQDQDVLDWVEQAQGQESDVAAKAAQVERVRVEEPKMLRSTLNQLFPQNRRSCDWPSPCQHAPICFGDDSMLTNPMASGLYQIRVPHHDAELAAQKGRT